MFAFIPLLFIYFKTRKFFTRLLETVQWMQSFSKYFLRFWPFAKVFQCEKKPYFEFVSFFA